MNEVLPPFADLASLLRRRREVIADHAFRDRDAAAHLDALREVSEAITAQHTLLRSQIPPRLNHYLTQCSFDKALGWLEGASE